MPEHLECDVLQNERYIHTLAFIFIFTVMCRIGMKMTRIKTSVADNCVKMTSSLSRSLLRIIKND